MPKYRDIPMSQRIDKIGELLAKGIYLYIQKQKEIEKGTNPCDNNSSLQKGNAPIPPFGEGESKNQLY